MQPSPNIRKLSDKSTWVVLIDPSSARRGMLADMVRSLGYAKVNTFSSLKDFLAFLSAEGGEPDWILTPLQDDQPVNAIHLLNLTVTEPRLRNTRVSLILDDPNIWWLQHAFELGLLSWHERQDNVQAQASAFFDVTSIAERNDWNETLVSAEYLRRHLTRSQRFAELLHLETSLISLFPQRNELGVRLAEALFYDNKLEAAAACLARVGTLDPFLAQTAAALQAKVEAGLERVSGARNMQVAVAQELGLNVAVIIDPDAAAANFCKVTLTKLGIKDIRIFDRGDTAWEAMKKEPEPSLIIQEWRLPGLSGDVLLQRIRNHGFHKVPIFVHSSLVKQNDRLILKEMGASDIIIKPQSQSQLAQQLTAGVKEERKPETVSALERSIRRAIAANDFAGARQLIDKLTASVSTPGLVRALEAEIAFQSGDTKLANSLAVEAIKIGGENVGLVNLLGKIYMKLRKFDQAAAFFGRADALSPGNVKRLCDLAEVHAERDEGDAAKVSLEKAKKLDPGNEGVALTEAKVALVGEDNPEVTKSLLMRVTDTSDLAAFLNNRGVGLALDGRLQEAVELYERALKALPKSLAQYRPAITYNLGLAQARRGDLASARWHLNEAMQDKNSGALGVKARSLFNRATVAQTKNEPLKFQSLAKKDDGVDPVEEILDLGRGLPVAFDVKPGTMRLHLVYQVGGTLDPRFMVLLANCPRFQGTSVVYARKKG